MENSAELRDTKGRLRRGDWMQTYTGIVFWPLDPLPEEISIRDIAHHLALMCRFNGACRGFYSVAQHSILVSETARRLAQQDKTKDDLVAARWGLLHDAAEAYLGDRTSPLKAVVPMLSIAEARITKVIASCFDLRWPIPDEIKLADDMVLATEKRDLMAPASAAKWRSLPQAISGRITPLTPEQAERGFIRAFEMLWPGVVVPPSGW